MTNPSTEAALFSGVSRPAFVRVLPFAVYVVLMALQSAIGSVAGVDMRWLYALRVAAVGGVLAYYWRDYEELAWRRARGSGSVRRLLEPLGALIVGAIVFVLWIGLDQGWMMLGNPGSGFVALDTNGARDWPLIVVRILGAAVVVPIMEELFWRSFFQRWIDKPRFLELDPSLVPVRALLITALLFGFEHSQWFAGVIAGLAYGWLYRVSGRLWIPVLAHGVTNFLLGCWVVTTAQWVFW